MTAAGLSFVHRFEPGTAPGLLPSIRRDTPEG